MDGIALGIMLIYLSKYQCIYDVPGKYNSDKYTKTQNMKPEPSQKKTINLISRLICEHHLQCQTGQVSAITVVQH